MFMGVDCADELLLDLEFAGVQLRVRSDGTLGVSPGNILTPEMREQIAANRDALIASLRRRCQVERLFTNAALPDSGTTNPQDVGLTDFAELVDWLSKVKSTLIPPIELCKGIAIVDLDRFMAWVEVASKHEVCRQLRWLRRVVEAREGGQGQ